MSWIAVAAMILASSSYSYDDNPETIQAHSRLSLKATTPCPGVWRGQSRG
jgi:hypothetical protein